MGRILLTLDAADAEELYRFLEHQYLDPNVYPRLSRLWSRIRDAFRSRALNVQGSARQSTAYRQG